MFVNTLTAVPWRAARFCAVTVTVIGPSGTPVNGRENWRVVPLGVRSSAEVKGGAVDSGGRPHCMVNSAGGRSPSPVTVPSMLMLITSSSAPFGGDVICTTGGCVGTGAGGSRSEEHTSELQSRRDLVCRLLLEKKKKKKIHALLCKKTKKKTLR